MSLIMPFMHHVFCAVATCQVFFIRIYGYGYGNVIDGEKRCTTATFCQMMECMEEGGTMTHVTKDSDVGRRSGGDLPTCNDEDFDARRDCAAAAVNAGPSGDASRQQLDDQHADRISRMPNGYASPVTGCSFVHLSISKGPAGLLTRCVRT